MREELPFPVKAFIVQQLAVFETPSTVAQAVKDTFGIEVTRQRVHYYDPTTKLGASLAPELVTLFHETRQKFRDDLDSIAIANPAVRLRMLDRQARLADQRGNAGMVAHLCEAAAKEMGGAFTNRHKHEHTGKDGKDLPPPAVVTIFKLPDNGRD